MRTLKMTIGVAIATCAFAVFAAPSFAAKEALKFGEFEATKVGTTISPSSPATVNLWKEGSASVSKLKLGGSTFGFNIKESKPEPEAPCTKEPTVKGEAEAEHSKELLLNIGFRGCRSWTKSGSGYGWKGTNFHLGMKFITNESAEIGKDSGLQITKTEFVKVANANKLCTVAIPAQFVPGNSEEKPEKFWEAAEYTPENEEPVENWEHSKKLQEQYPGDVKKRLFIETTEKFKRILTYVDTRPTGKEHGCTPVKGEENTHYEDQKELEPEPGVKEPNPWYQWTRHEDGEIFMEIEGLEIKGGQLTFIPPA
jgi:hypothetical protein